MSPEELAAYREWIRISKFASNSWPCMALDHIDQQAAQIAELDDAVSGPLENITKMLETVNADTIFAGIVRTWKNENLTLKSQITDMEKRNADLEARVAALKEIAGEERAAVLACFEDAYGVTEEHRLEARRQLAKEHLEAFR